jgi:hypothetical protein
VRDVASGRALEFDIRCSVVDQLVGNTDPLGELAVRVPADVVDGVATALRVELGPAPS